MKANEQIALLRRACEILWDWYGGRLTVSQFHDRWCPPGMSAGEFTSRAYNESMLATATPPDDDAAQLPKKRDELVECNEQLRTRINRLDDEMKRICAEAGEVYDPATPLGRHSAAMVPGFIHALRYDRDSTVKERDEALAKLSELHDIIEQHHNGYGETGKALGWKKPESHVAALRELLTEQVELASHEALAKLAAAQKELAETKDAHAKAIADWADMANQRNAAQNALADIRSAKPEPEYRALASTIRAETYVQRRVQDPRWATVATCIDHDNAQCIADALNAAGGKP